MLYVVPIEPLEERYSAQWMQWTRAYLKQQKRDSRKYKLRALEYSFINPPAYNRINTGAFLDAIGTHVYKNAQLKIILDLFSKGKINHGDIFWFHDLWFPGLEMLAYIRAATGIKFKIYGCLHAGTYDPYDFLSRMGMEDWGKYLENSWLTFVDGVFVATKFHKSMLTSFRGIRKNKVHVTGFPIYETYQMTQAANSKSWDKRQNVVVFPHRLDPEKQPHLCEELQRRLDIELPGFRVIRTKDYCITKDDYYNMLHNSKFAVSFALQETWGIAMQEAVICGCVPIVPNRLSYREMYSGAYRYGGQNISQIIKIIKNQQIPDLYTLTEQKKTLLESGRLAFDNMMNIMFFGE